MEKLIEKFSRESGFKVLAMARLGQVECSVVFYLLNCAASHLTEVITTDVELASLIGYSEADVRRVIDSLAQREIIKLRYGAPHSNPDKESLRIGLQFDVSLWKLDFNADVNSKDAVVFPFRRFGSSHLQLLTNKTERDRQAEGDLPAWRRVVTAFFDVNPSEQNDHPDITDEHSARILVETHPIDQVLVLIRHFKHRIPTLSLLASSWQHFQELYEGETQKVDLSDARKKNQELDQLLREAAQKTLSEDLKETTSRLNEEERTVLEILSKHQYPRRQLFWAYQTRGRYPALAAFFDANAHLMLGVTTTGRILPPRKT